MTNAILDHSKYTQQLYNNAQVNLASNTYRNVIDKDEMRTKLTGVVFDNRQELISKLQVGEELFMVHDVGNKAHANAIKVVNGNGEQVGFLPRELADIMVKQLHKNDRLIFVEAITGEELDNKGVNIVIQKVKSENTKNINIDTNVKAEVLIENIAKQLGASHLIKVEDIKKLTRQNQNGNQTVLSGNDEHIKKSIISVLASFNALKERGKTLFIYNTNNAMIEDSKVLNIMVDSLDLKIKEINEDYINGSFEEFAQDADILITTAHNLDLISYDYEFGLVVINHLDQNIENISITSLKGINAQHLLLNLYGFSKFSKESLVEVFGIKNFVDYNIEGYANEAVFVDKRNIENKDLFIKNVILRNPTAKSIIFTNTRNNAVAIARNLRNQLPRELKDKIIFYHSGLSYEDKKIIEEKFVLGEYLYIVSTTAFDIALNPDNQIKNVFVYTIPFTYHTFINHIMQTIKWNVVTVYMLYSYNDIHFNKGVIQNSLIDKSDLTYVYKTIQHILILAIQEQYGVFNIKVLQLREEIKKLFGKEYTNNKLITILETLDEMKVIRFDKKSNDLFIEVFKVQEKSSFEKTKIYKENEVLMKMYIEFELLLMESIQDIYATMFYNKL